MERLPEQPWLLNTCVQADQRDQLARFWLAAPEDLLPSLWSSPVGEATKSMVRALDAANPLHSGTGGHPECHWCPSPGWLSGTHGDSAAVGQFPVLPSRFAHHCQCGESASAVVDLGLPRVVFIGWHGIPSAVPAPQQQESAVPATMPPQPDFGQFPATLQELVGNRIQLNRLLGLSNLYYIDPEDQEILQELREVRLALISAIEQCPENQLESIWASDLGDRYWALGSFRTSEGAYDSSGRAEETCGNSEAEPQCGRWLRHTWSDQCGAGGHDSV